MPNTPRILAPTKTSQQMAMFLAMVVRNAMEDFHHEYLTDEQMKELNPIIRNAICTGLHALRYCDKSEGARSYVNFHTLCIPQYWEPPDLLVDFIETVKMSESRGAWK